MSDSTPIIRISPEELAEVLGGNTPTAEQSAIISAPLEPMLVVAGAGSGKTATMTDRVLWLVANGWVSPDEVLGVTFTRKAAGELSTRVRRALTHFAEINRVQGIVPELKELDEVADPRVSTYHSYANSLVSDYGLRLGIERDVTLMGQAQAWQLASRVVESFDGPMDAVDSAKSTLVSAVLNLAGECAEHLKDASVAYRLPGRPHQKTVEEWVSELLARFESLPPKLSGRAANSAAGAIIAKLSARQAVARMVGQYARAKAERGFLDYGDLVALAATIAENVPQAAATERARSKVVILDEFQDTSYAQSVLFSRLFGEGHAVTAVGDPNQSIYGFRGASAGQLFRFPQTFPRVGPDGTAEPSPTAYLTTAWRNGSNILDAANLVASRLEVPHGATAIPALKARPQAPEGVVVAARFIHQDQESQVLAQDIANRRRTHRGETMAVLCRARRQMSSVTAALESRDIPYEVVGLGGLLDTPEVRDLVATLHVLADPGRSDKLMRLLAGARWRLGASDLMALRDWSAHLARGRRRAPASSDAPVMAPDTVEEASLIEALDFLPQPGWESHDGRSLSPEALARLTALGSELRRLRSFLGDDLGQLITEVERAMLLDIEVAARPGRSTHQARRNLDAFAGQVHQFTRVHERVDVLAFLSWLEAAAAEENGLAAAATEPNPEAVQILTAHASKGLEWDSVFVPGINQGDFPSRQAAHWDSEVDTLPWPLRGDAESLPVWDTEEDGQAEWTRSAKLFVEDAKSYAEQEERRLAYVAFTRAKTLLWVSTTAYTGTSQTVRDASPFIVELLEGAGLSFGPDDAGLEVIQDPAAISLRLQLHPGSVPAENIPTANPASDVQLRALWPYDPLEGPVDAQTLERRSLVPGRRRALEASAALVHHHQHHGAEVSVQTEAGRVWLEDAELLVAARNREPRRNEVHLPTHISASTLVDLGADPEGVARNLRRPVPREPGQAARKGTAFHSWVEAFYGKAGMLDLDEPLTEDADIDTALGVDELVDRFKDSAWAQRTPAFIEAPVETQVGPVVVRGRIDAVFRDADGGWDLIDWKTGREPRGQDLAQKSVQLAVYRLAWSRLNDVPLEMVRAAFVYVTNGAEVRPHDLGDAESLERIITEALTG